MNKSSHRKDKANVATPYPRHCVDCGEEKVCAAKIAYDAKIKHDGKLHAFHIDELPVDRCSHCGEVFFTNATSDAQAQALRRHLGLLQPDEIRQLLRDHRLTQRKLAEHLRVAEESVSRWLNGLSIQSRSLDALLRVYFTFPQVREMLSQQGDLGHQSDSSTNPATWRSDRDRLSGQSEQTTFPSRTWTR